MTTYNYPSSSFSLPANAATEAKQDDIISELQGIAAIDYATEAKQDTTNTKLDTLIAKDFATTAKQDSIISELQSLNLSSSLGVIDQIDATPLLDCSLTNIPASSGNPVAVVASLAAACRKIVTVEDIGEFIGLYTGVALSETLYCVLPLGGGEIEVDIPIATRISLRAMKNTAISSSYISINFLG